jgi:hypothetical protein
MCAEEAPCARVALLHDRPPAPRALAGPGTAHVVCLCGEVGMGRRARGTPASHGER